MATPRILLSIALVLMSLGTAQAQVQISLDPLGGSSVTLNSAPNQTIDFYLSTAPGTTTPVELFAAAPTFDFSSPLSALPVVSLAPAGNTATGSPFLGDGNLAISDAPAGAITNSSFTTNQDFTVAQALSSTPELWLSLIVDTSGLAPGEFQINLPDTEVFISPTATFFTPNNNLTFTVVAVPEPTSVAVIGILAVAVASRRQRTCR